MEFIVPGFMSKTKEGRGIEGGAPWAKEIIIGQRRIGFPSNSIQCCFQCLEGEREFG